MLVIASSAAPHSGHAPQDLGFTPPKAGTYRLESIQEAPGGNVLDESGREHSLSEYTRGRITLLGLIYTRCADPDGCPRSTWAFSEVRSLLRAHPALEKRVRLVSLSFDAEHDTPAHLAKFAGAARNRERGAAWHFLTTRSPREAAPIVEGFGQDLRVPVDAPPDAAPEFTHTLKVFLIDPRGTVREIYSSAFLMPPMIVNDIRTLALEK
jgi:cytochrome oxidase Cu insertion factor (SCO1/SenC/PrrC family)